MGRWPATVHENARSALECGSLLPLSPGQLAGRPLAVSVLRAWPRASSRSQSGSKAPHSRASATLKSCFFNADPAHFHGSERWTSSGRLWRVCVRSRGHLEGYMYAKSHAGGWRWARSGHQTPHGAMPYFQKRTRGWRRPCTACRRHPEAPSLAEGIPAPEFFRRFHKAAYRVSEPAKIALVPRQ